MVFGEEEKTILIKLFKSNDTESDVYSFPEIPSDIFCAAIRSLEGRGLIRGHGIPVLDVDTRFAFYTLTARGIDFVVAKYKSFL